MDDPNWLLSAVAQSTAALVAIVGGLVVSRVISLAGERSGLERQIASLTQARRQTQREADQRRAEMVAYFADQAIEEWSDALLAALPGSLTNEELYEAMEDDGHWLLSDYAGHLDALRATFDEAVSSISEAYDSGGLRDLVTVELPESADDLAEHGVAVPEWENPRRVWDRVARYFRDVELEDRRRRSEELDRATGGSLGLAYLHALTSQGGRREYAMPLNLDDPVGNFGGESDSERYVRLLGEVEALDAELNVLRHALEDVKSPRRLWVGFWVLAGFAVLGILYPMVVMASGPAMPDLAIGVTTIGAFTIGLVALFVYIATFVRDLGADREDDAPGRPGG